MSLLLILLLIFYIFKHRAGRKERTTEIQEEISNEEHEGECLLFFENQRRS